MGHSKKLNKLYFRTNTRKDYFKHGDAETWTSIDDDVVNAITLHTFKNNLDKKWKNLSIRFNYSSHLTDETRRIWC